jgi:hypothetical protein
VHDGVSSLGRKPAINETVHPSKPVDPPSHIFSFALGDLRPVAGDVADHRAIVVKGSVAQCDGACSMRHDHGQSRRAAVVFSDPQPASVDDLAAERWDPALDNEPWICSAWPDGKPQRQRPDQAIKVIDNEPAQAVGRDRFPVFVFGKYPKVVVTKFYVPRVERLVQVIVAMVAANQPIRIEVISEVQGYAIPVKNSLKSGLSCKAYAFASGEIKIL